MNFTLLSQGRVITISRLSACHALVCEDKPVSGYSIFKEKMHLYVEWYIIGRRRREKALTRQIREIVGQLIEDGWDCTFVG